MNEFKYIPKEFWPSVEEHIQHETVYRGVKSTNILHVDDFLPWNIENSNQMKKFNGLFKQPYFGTSVFTNLENLRSVVKNFPALGTKIKAYAVGFTSIEKGISKKENLNNHVDYYLYDYINNSPKDDFNILEVRKYEK